MSFRVAPSKLARSAAHVGATTTAASPPSSSTSSSPSTAVRPLLQFPAFHPTPFEHEKFLSIKTRSLENYTKLRGDVLQRCAELRSQIERSQERAGGRDGSGATPAQSSETQSSPFSSSSADNADIIFPRLPLSPHQAEELLLLSKKVESLAETQGMVLPDELVWRMFHLCVQCGAPQQALEKWMQLHILAEHRGPPYPLLVLDDLAVLLRTSVLARLPEGGASLSCRSSVLCCADEGRTAAASTTARLVGLEDGVVAAQRYLHLRCLHDADHAWSAGSDDGRPSSPLAELYTTHLMRRYVWPVWRSLASMELTLDALKNTEAAAVDDMDGDAGEGTGEEEVKEDSAAAAEGERSLSAEITRWLPDIAQQTAAARKALMSVTPLYSLHAAPASGSAPSKPTHGAGEHRSAEALASKTVSQRASAASALDPPSFPSEVDAVLAPLRALLDVWLAVAQCAAEAKEVKLLCEVQRTVCAGFLCTAEHHGGEEASRVEQTPPAIAVNKAAWCHYQLPSLSPSALQDTAEAQARAVVHNFLGGALSVIQYGLLCAEQEAALWHLHDTSTLVLGAAAMLRRLSGAADRSPHHNNSLPRRLQALAVAQHQSKAEAERSLLCEALPRALRSTTPTDLETTRTDAAMMTAMEAFLTFALSPNSPPSLTNEHVAEATLRYADAGLYVGLTTNNGVLLRQAAAAASMPLDELAVLQLTAQLLQQHRRALAALGDRQCREEHYDDVSSGNQVDSEKVWTEVRSWMTSTRKREEESGGTGALTSHLRDGCLQVLLLDMARQQAESAASFVRAVFPTHQTSGSNVEDVTATEANAQDGGAGVGAEHEEEEEDGGAAAQAPSPSTSFSAEQEAISVEVAEQALARLNAQSTQTIVQGLARVAQVLQLPPSTPDLPPLCLSPSALSSLAVVTRVGTYVENDARTFPASIPVASLEALTSSLDVLVTRLATDACAVLRENSAASADSPGSSAAVAGSWVQWVLLALTTRKAWASVLEVLKTLDGDTEKAGRTTTGAALAATPQSLLCAATVDPSVFATIYAAAQEDGAASVCAYMRPRRASLFF